MGFCNSVKKGYIAFLCAFLYSGIAGCGEGQLIPAQVTRKEFHRIRVFTDPFHPRYTDFKIVDDDTSRPLAEIWLDARRDTFWRTFKGALRIGK